jgi:hypothetical protein
VALLLLRTHYFSSFFLIGGLVELVLGIDGTLLDGLAVLPGLVGLGIDVVLGSPHAVLHRVLSVLIGSARPGLSILRLDGGREGRKEGGEKGGKFLKSHKEKWKDIHIRKTYIGSDLVTQALGGVLGTVRTRANLVLQRLIAVLDLVLGALKGREGGSEGGREEVSK